MDENEIAKRALKRLAIFMGLKLGIMLGIRQVAKKLVEK